MNPKIMIVDDEPDVVELVERTLKTEGFGVVCAYDGIAALDMVSSERPDLILLDIMMPMMSGYEVCEQLKANPQTQHIPVLCVTSANTPEAKAQSMHAGAADMISKPFIPDELVAQIYRHLHKAKA